MKRKILVICTMLIFFILTGCNNSKGVANQYDFRNVEEAIQNDSSSFAKDFKRNKDVKLCFERKEDRIIIYTTGFEDVTFEMLINCDFYDNDKVPEAPKYSKVLTVPKEQLKYFEDAKKIVKAYVNDSKAIHSEDKQNCCKAIDEIDLICCNFEDDTNDNRAILMTTTEQAIFINNRLIQFCDKGCFIHELIHVVSNVTNTRSDYSYYRSSMLDEALTDIIAFYICQTAGVKKLKTSYESYFEYTYYLINKFDMIHTYYYADKYADIISEIGQDRLDMLILIFNNLDSNLEEPLTFLLSDIL